jgi:hypothetical protein
LGSIGREMRSCWGTKNDVSLKTTSALNKEYHFTVNCGIGLNLALDKVYASLETLSSRIMQGTVALIV